MVQPMKVNGQMVLWMEKESLHGLMVKKKLEFGKMVNYKNEYECKIF